MSSLVIILFLFVCATLHACNARHHFVVHEKIKVSEEQMVENNGILTGNSRGYETIEKENYLKFLFKEDHEEISGSERNEKILQGLKQEDTKLKGWKRRLMLATKTEDNEETVDSKGEGDEEAGVVEDVVAMDYAQPHRKPPIHNEEN